MRAGVDGDGTGPVARDDVAQPRRDLVERTLAREVDEGPVRSPPVVAGIQVRHIDRQPGDADHLRVKNARRRIPGPVIG